jgi:sulfite exporter TauE/SafE
MNEVNDNSNNKIKNNQNRNYISILFSSIKDDDEANLLIKFFRILTYFVIGSQLGLLGFLYFFDTDAKRQLIAQYETSTQSTININVVYIAILASILIYIYSIYAIGHIKNVWLGYIFLIFIFISYVLNFNFILLIYFCSVCGAVKACSYFKNRTK